MGRTTKSGKREMNPTDAYRKEQRKKEIKKNKKDRKRVRELGSWVKDPNVLKEEVRRHCHRRRGANWACTFGPGRPSRVD